MKTPSTPGGGVVDEILEAHITKVSLDKKSTAAKYHGDISYIITYGTTQHLSEYDIQK